MNNLDKSALYLAKECCRKRKASMDMTDEYFTDKNGNELPQRIETINLNMSITNNKAFDCPYAKIRELLQNAIDHLHMGLHGMRRSDVLVKVEECDGGVTKILFVCCDEEMLKIVVSDDELCLYQSHTYPLEKATLRNPVEDPTKQNSSQAGGFGEGYKVAIRQWLYDGAQVFYEMTGEAEKIVLNFGAKKPRVRTSAYSSHDTMFVKCISKRRTPASSIKRSAEVLNNKRVWLHPNTLLVSVKQVGIGQDFFQTVVPRMAIFLDIQRSPSGLQTASGNTPPPLYEHNGDIIAQASALKFHPAIQKYLDNLEHVPVPLPGVYVMGLYVQESFFSEAAYFAGSNSDCQVAGRDRNFVREAMFQRALRKLLVGASDHSDQRGRLESSLNACLDPRTAGSDAWMLPDTKSFFKQAFFGHEGALKRLHGFPEECEFVNVGVNDAFLSWAILKCNANRPESIVPLDEDKGKHTFDRISASKVKKIAIDSLPDAESQSAAVRALGLVRIICFESVPSDDASILIKHASSCNDEFEMEHDMTYTIVVDSTHVATETIQTFYRLIQGNRNRSRANEMFRKIYNLEDKADNTDAILDALERLCKEATEVSAEVPVEEIVTDDNDDDAEEDEEHDEDSEDSEDEEYEDSDDEDSDSEDEEDEDSDDDEDNVDNKMSGGSEVVEAEGEAIEAEGEAIEAEGEAIEAEGEAIEAEDDQVFRQEAGIYTSPHQELPDRVVLETRKALATQAMDFVCSRVPEARLERVRLTWSPSSHWYGINSPSGKIILNLALIETKAEYIVKIIHQIAHDVGHEHGHGFEWLKKFESLCERVVA